MEVGVLRKTALFTAALLIAVGYLTSSQAKISADPHGILALVEQGEQDMRTMTLINDSEQAITFEIGIDVRDLDEIEGHEGIPRRDQPEGRFALFQDTQYFGWVEQLVFRRVQDLDYEYYNQAADLGEVDLDEFDCVWISGCDQSAQFAQNWADNLERFEDFVSRGKVIFIENGWNRQSLGTLPGGVREDRNPQEGILVVGPEDNWMIDQCGFREGQFFDCGNTTHVVWPEARIEDAEDSDWYQIIMVSDQNRQPCEFIYEYGRGFVIVSGQPAGHVWGNHGGQGDWGSRGPALLEWMGMLSTPGWIMTDPEEGEIEGNGELEVEVQFNTEEMEASVNWAVLEIETNDPMQPMLEVPVLMTIGLPIFSIGGTVTREDGGAPVEDVMVSTVPFNFIRHTDEDGCYEFTEAPLAEFDLIFTKEDYLPHMSHHEIDEAGEYEYNVSMLHAECNLDPDEIITSLAPDSDQEHRFTVSNDGTGPLTYLTEKRLIGEANADPWEFRNAFDAGQIVDDNRLVAAVFVDGFYYVAGGFNGAVDQNKIYIFDEEYNLIDDFDQFAETRYGMRDLAYGNGLLWGPDGRDIYGFTIDGELEVTLQSPENPTRYMTYDTENDLIWLSSVSTDLVALNLQGEEIYRHDNPGIRVYGLAYWPDDPDSYNLYVFGEMENDDGDYEDGHLVKVNTDDGESMWVTRIETEDRFAGIEITNQVDVYSWVIVGIFQDSDQVGIYQVEARKDWMQVVPSDGMIEAEQEQEFVLTLDTNELPAVMFHGEIVFIHDGEGGETHLPITMDVVEGPVHTTRTIQLGMGWNMVSMYLQPDEEDVVVLTSGLVDDGVLVMMKDGYGHFYRPEFNFNDIPGWFVDQGYMMRMTEPAELELEGVTVLAEEPIELEEGWQIIAYYPRMAVEATIALSNVREQLRIAKDGYGNFYVPAWDFNSIPPMEPGQGYYVAMLEDVDLVWALREGDELAGYSVHRNRSVYQETGSLSVHPVTGFNMSLLITCEDDVSGEIGVYCKDQLVGSGVIQDGRCGIAVWGDDPSTETIDGALSGQPLELVLYNDLGRYEVIYSNLAGEGAYRTDDIWVVKLESVGTLPTEFGIISAHPNPFNSSTRLSFNLPSETFTEMSVYDMNGRLVSELVSGRMSAGLHSISFDGSDLASGVYMVQLKASGQVSRWKITLLK